MTKNVPVEHEPEDESTNCPVVYVAQHMSGILHELCAGVLFDALECPEIWLGTERRERILLLASAVIRTIEREIEQ